MKISIVTTAFNAEKYIEETLESVLSQRGNFEIEYIVYDAKSTDSTLEKIYKYKKLVDEGFYNGRNNGIVMKVFSESDNGMYEGIAKGFKLVTGDIVAYINADDFYMPNAFSCVQQIFDKYKEVNWIIGIANTYNLNGNNICNELRLYSKKLTEKGVYGLIFNYYVQQESTFWRKELLDEIDFEQFASYKMAGDFYLWHKFAGKHQLYTICSILSGFRKLPVQKSSNTSVYNKEMKKNLKH